MAQDKRFQPAQVLAVSFLTTILVGTVLLSLPISTTGGEVSLIDALFTSTSAVCVTGLVVQDTPTFWSPVGKVILLVLIQLGGLGIMTFSTLILFMAGRKIAISERILVREGYHPGAPRDFRSLIMRIFLYTFVIELAGAISLFSFFLKDYPWPRAASLSVFHSISAFCNAGFALFSDSFVGYRHSAWLNITVMMLIILGGIGFLVLQETRQRLFTFVGRRKAPFSLHAKLVLSATAVLIGFSFLIFLAMEWSSSLKGFSTGEKILASLFQVVTARTAGFNTIDMAAIGTSTAFLLILLMFIGASPGSTGGGVKTSTVGVITAFLRSKIAAREATSLFYRTLPLEVVMKAFTLVSLAFGLVFLSSFFISLFQPELPLKEVLFEVVSAFGTVGLSLGATMRLNALGKAVIIITMYTGRIGLLVLLYALSRRRALGRFEYVEESVLIG